MNLRQRILLALALAIGAAAHAEQEPRETVVNPGLVVESVTPNFQADLAEIREGDVLVSWSRGDLRGKLESPFDLSWVQFEQAPRGKVTLEGRRDATLKTWELTDVANYGWGIEARPEMPPDMLSLYQQGERSRRAGKLTEALDFWQKASDQSRKNAPAWLETWLAFHSAHSLQIAQQWQAAENTFQIAFEKAKDAGPAIRSQIIEAWAETAKEKNTTDGEAKKLFLQAIAENQKLGSESVAVARMLHTIGVMLRELDDLKQAEDDYRQALAIAQKVAPDSVLVGQILLDLGRIAYKHGDLNQAEKYYRQALAVTEKVAPGSLDDAWCLNSLGLLHADFSDFAKAKEYLQQARVIRERLLPGGSMAASSLLNLGIVANATGDLVEAESYLLADLAVLQKLQKQEQSNWTEKLTMGIVYTALGELETERDELAKAEQYHRKALAIREKLAPGSLLTAENFSGIGEIAARRDDWRAAERYLQQSLVIQNKLAPDSLRLAETLVDLGTVARGRGDLDGAESYFRRSLAIAEKRAPGNLDEVAALHNLGLVHARRGDVVAAEDLLSRALTMIRQLTPNSPDLALILNDLGNVERGRGELTKAEQHYHEALELEEKFAPGSAEQAETLIGLAAIKRRSGELESAAELFEMGLNAFENHTSRLGGLEESRSGFRAKFLSYYEDSMDLLIEQKKPGLAFQVAERSRARTLLEMLTAAHADIHKGGDPALLERERSLDELIFAKTNRRVQLLNRTHTAEQIAAADHEINELLTQSEDVRAQIRANSPDYAALTQPRALAVKEIQEHLLDTNTVLLEYSLGEERSYVFAVTPASVSAYELPKQAEIEAVARRVYDILVARAHREKGESDLQWMQRASQAEARYPEAAAALSKMILDPVAPLLGAKRLLIVGDGILQYVPFAALPSPGADPVPVPLIANHEIANLPSASVLQMLQSQSAGRSRPARAVAVLADPVFRSEDERVRRVKQANLTQDEMREEAQADQSISQALLLRSATDVGMADGVFPRLLFTRHEADSILKQAPVDQSLKAVDFEASLATATNPDLGQYRIIHFATHGLLDSEHPELSGLVLSLVDKHGKPQNGFLQLTDIYNLNLPADMVVLSACETGLGKQVRAEGLVGITRGFMYAGASRVVASLWKVDDAATAELMGSFYKGIFKDHLSPAAALQRAQVEMWNEKRWSAPYYWAGFVLEGEW
jgi:CHAT domain-containing protein/Tfp pilus assembly protein PilF